MAASIKKIDAESCRNFNPLVTFDCRGLQPTDFTPGVRMDLLLLSCGFKLIWMKRCFTELYMIHHNIIDS